MNKYSIKKALFPAFLLVMLLFAGCRKDDGPIRKEFLDLIDAVPAISTNLDPTSSLVISPLDMGSFVGKFNVSEFFDGPGSFSPDRVDLVVMKNGARGEAVRVYSEDISLPASFTVTAADLASFFGAELQPEDSYDFSTDIYVNGKRYEAFPLGGVSTSPGPTAVPGFSHQVRYSVICPYDPDIYEGEFEVVMDAFQDLAPGDIVEITRIDDEHFSYIYPSGVNPTPIIVTVNPLTNEVTIDKQKFGDRFTWQPAYTNPNAESSPHVDNVVLPCQGSFSVLINYTVDQGSFGAYRLTMKKVQ